MKNKVIKLHFKKAKPKYHKFWIKKKRTKNGRAYFSKKKIRFSFKIITFNIVFSPSLNHSQEKKINMVSENLKEKFPKHEIIQVRGLVKDEVINIIKGVDK